MHQFMNSTQLIFLFRILLAGICGLIIGLERKNRAKEAGIRTHFVVACAAALMMIVSKYAFFDVISEGLYGNVEVRLDPSRVASTIASGIGFLGAGMIFVHKNTVTGLTTAAGIWAISGVGMCIGAGMYFIGISTTVLILLGQIIFHKNFKWLRIPHTSVLQIFNVDRPNYQKQITEELKEKEILVLNVTVEKNDDNTRNYKMVIDKPVETTEDEIVSMFEYRCSIRNN